LIEYSDAQTAMSTLTDVCATLAGLGTIASKVNVAFSMASVAFSFVGGLLEMLKPEENPYSDPNVAAVLDVMKE